MSVWRTSDSDKEAPGVSAGVVGAVLSIDASPGRPEAAAALAARFPRLQIFLSGSAMIPENDGSIERVDMSDPLLP